MFCTNCGNKNSDDVKFCTNCGKDVNPPLKNERSSETEAVTKTGSKKWVSFGVKIVFLIIFVITVINGVAYTYQWYKELPREANQLGVIEIGMKPVEVTLKLGKPENESRSNETNHLSYTYFKYNNELEYYIVFDDNERVRRICTMDVYKNIMGLSVYDSEEKILSKLGQPSKTSVNNEGTRKVISFFEYNLAFEIERNRVRFVCVTTTEMSYTDEYQGI